MINDIRTLAGRGLRHITVNDKDSLADYGALIARDSVTDTLYSKSATDDLTYTDGLLDSSAIMGRLFFEPRELRYKFKIMGSDEAELNERRSALYTWLQGIGKSTIADSKYAVTENNVTINYVFTNCTFKSAEYEVGEKSAEIQYCYVSALITCDPFLVKPGFANERVLKFTANGTAALTVTNNAAYSLTADGVTATGSITVTSPYKYRLVCFAENPETITLNGVAITAGTVFTMPANAEIIISADGYKYVELWHDTRTGVML